MAERTIVGVDFSGDEKNNSTWMTTGDLRDGALELKSCERLSKKRGDAHQYLEKRLRAFLLGGAIVAMDFPFGVPQAFADTGFCPNASKISDLWEAANSKGDLKDYLEGEDGLKNRLQKGNLKEFMKCKRTADKELPESYSPLNPAQPNMLPMTLYGMQMLYRLWNAPDLDFHVPLRNDANRKGPLLMEVMPGAALYAFRLPHKTYKKHFNALQERQKIFDELSTRFDISILNLSKFRDHCMFSDDALDSIVAAVVAAKWARGDEFQHPNPNANSIVQVEGCIFVPMPIQN